MSNKMCAAPAVVMPAGERKSVVFFPHSQVRVLAPNSVFTILDRCRQFRYRHEHVATIEALTPTPELKALLLDSDSLLVSAGLWLQENELIAVAAQHTSQHSSVWTPIAALCIPTCDRPSELKRAITSYSAHITRDGGN